MGKSTEASAIYSITNSGSCICGLVIPIIATEPSMSMSCCNVNIKDTAHSKVAEAVVVYRRAIAEFLLCG